MKFDRAPELATEQFDFLASLIYEQSGIVITPAKRGLLMARLNKRLRALGLSDYSEYCKYLKGNTHCGERREMVSSITTNVTSFFREKHHFDCLSEKIFPQLISKAREGCRIRVWSCACSSGEEPYSIAMTLLSIDPHIQETDFLILGTDIDPMMIKFAESGVYAAQSLDAIKSEKYRSFFTKVDAGFKIKDNIKGITRFAELNLHDDWGFSGSFNVIFCRNVVIYFDSTARNRLWQRLSRQLIDGGVLFIGHSERLDGEATKTLQYSGPSQYIKVT